MLKKIQEIPIVNRIIKSEFNRNVLILTSGTAIAQAIPILITPILTRLYTPADFGAFALFVSIVSIVSVISCGRYELAIMLPEKDEDAINVAAVAFIFNILVSFLFFIFLLLFGDWLLKLLKAEVLKGWIYLAPLTVFMIGIFNILNYANNRFKLYKDIAKANVYKSIAIAIIQLIFGFLKAGYVGLISGQVFGHFVANVKLFKNINLFIKFINYRDVFKKAKVYKNFPIISSFGALMDNMTGSLPYLTLPKIFGLTYSGYFFLSLKLVLLPLNLISSNIGQILFKEITVYKFNKPEILKNVYKKTFLKLLLASIIYTIVISLFVIFLWEATFGNKWAESKIISMYIIPIIFIRSIASPLSIVLVAMEKLGLLTTWQILYFLLNVLVIAITFFLSLSFYNFLILFVFNEVVIYIFYLILTYWVISTHK